MRPERILVIRFSSLGDLLLTEPFLRRLRERHPTDTIALVTKKEFAPIISSWPFGLQLITLAEDGSLGALRDQLFAFKPDHCFDLHASLRSRWLTAWLPGNCRRQRKYYIRRWLLVHTSYRKQLPFVTQRYLQLLNDVSELELPRWYSFAEQQLPAQPVLALVPGAGKLTKSWPVDYWEQLVQQLTASGWKLEIFGGAAERSLGDLLAVSTAAGQVTNYCGSLDLEQVATRIRAARLVVTGDTGLLHLATAVGCEILLLAGSTTRELGFLPPYSRLTIVEREQLRCRPCSHIGRDICPLQHFACMRELTPALVQKTIERIIANPAGDR